MNPIKQILLLFMMFCSVQLLAEDEWQLITDKKGVKVYQKQQSGQPYKLTKGVVTVQAKAAMVLALLNDFNVCDQWVHGCIESYRQADGNIYMVFDGPLFFKDREVMLQSFIEYLKDADQWLIEVENKVQKTAKNDHVIINSMQANWLLSPLSDSLVIEHTFYVDPNVAVKLGINRYNSRAMYRTLSQMLKMLQLPKYQAHQELPEMLQRLKN